MESQLGGVAVFSLSLIRVKIVKSIESMFLTTGVKVLANRIEGTVSSISGDGALVTDISNESLADVPHGENTLVKFGDFETIGVFSSDHQQPDATMVAFLGNTGYLEIEIVGISLAEMLGVRVGESVVVQW